MGPYRVSIKQMEKLSFEEHIIRTRTRIPAPLQRLLGVVVFLPIICLSGLLAVFVLAPICWVLLGTPATLWDKSYHSDGMYIYYNRYGFVPLVRGTLALFYNRLEFYKGIRIGEVEQAE